MSECGPAGRGLADSNPCAVGQDACARPIRHVLEASAQPIRHVLEARLFGERTSVGMDVQARSVAAAATDGRTGELRQASEVDAVTRSDPDVDRRIARSGRGDLRGGPQLGSGWIGRSRRQGSDVWSRRRRTCNARRVIG